MSYRIPKSHNPYVQYQERVSDYQGCTTRSFCWFINRAQRVCLMGGAKKPTAANKSSGGKDSKKGKKDKGSESGPKRAEIVVKVNEGQALKIIKNSKVITVQDLARQMGVKISAANAFLKKTVSDGSTSIIGGYSGHYLYRDAKAAAEAAAAEAKKAKAKKKATEKPPAPKPDAQNSSTQADESVADAQTKTTAKSDTVQ